MGKRELKYGKIRGWLCRPDLFAMIKKYATVYRLLII